EESSKTFSAVWRKQSSNAVAAMGKAAEPILQKFTPAIETAGTNVSSFFDNISKGKAGGGSKVLQDLSNYAGQLGNKLKPAVKPIQGIWGALKTLGPEVSKFGGALQKTLGPILKEIAGALGTGLKNVANIIQ